MSDWRKAVKQAQHRFWVNRSLSTLGWSIAAAAGLFILAVAIDRIWIASEYAGQFLGALALILTALALIASAIWTAFTRETITDSATRLDVAAGLKERLSSALFCENASDPFAQAVVTDARRLGQTLEVRQHVPVQVPRSAGYAGSTLLVALLFFWLFPTIDLAGNQQQRDQEQQRKDRVEHAEAQVKPQLEQAFQKLSAQNPTLKKELDGLKPLAQADLQNPTDVRNQAIKQINNVRQKLTNQVNSKELAKVGELKKMLRQLTLQPQANLPVNALAKAMAKGDFESAQAAIEAIKQELAKKPKTPEEQQRAAELKKQLDQLSKQVKRIAENDNKIRNLLAKSGLNDKDIAKALENMKKNDTEAIKKQLADKGLSKEQIDKLAKQVAKRCSACSMASKLAQNFAQGAQGPAGQLSESAAQALSAAGQQLSDMEAMEQELNQLMSAAADMDALKDQLGQACSACNGIGMCNGQPCSACQGTGMCMGQGRGPGPGMGGLGQGKGGLAPRQQTSFKTVKRRTRVNTTPGSIISQKFVDGEQYSGEVSDEFVEAVISAQRDITDATPLKPLPRIYHKSRSLYFDHTGDDLPADKIKAAQSKLEEK